MKIGLIDVDSHNFPNLCLMKLSAYHKAKGHTVEWWNAKGRYDLVYKSRVFTDTYSKDTITVTNAEQVISAVRATTRKTACCRKWNTVTRIILSTRSFSGLPTAF